MNEFVVPGMIVLVGMAISAVLNARLESVESKAIITGMIPENPTRSESKSAMFAVCHRDPQIGEIFEITAAGVTERWVMSGITWEREIMRDFRGYAVPLPVRPRMTYEFKVIAGDLPLTIAHRMDSNMKVKASEWRYWQEQGMTEYIGCLDLFDTSCVQLLSPRLELVNSDEVGITTDEL